MRLLCSPSSSLLKRNLVHRYYQTWTFGSGVNGALGHFREHGLQDFSEPTLVESLKDTDVVKCSGGWGHSAVITRTGQIVIFGRALDMINTIRLVKFRNSFPTIFNLISMVPFSLGKIDYPVPTEIFLFQKDGKEKINANKPCRPIDVACSAGLSLFLTEDGDVFSFGANRYGQGGINSKDVFILEPRRVSFEHESMEKPFITKISAGFQHVLALSKNGILYAWGKGSRGQLGLGSAIGPDSDDPLNSRTRFPRVVSWSSPDQSEIRGLPKNKVVVDISAGFNHSAAVLEDGTLWIWGQHQSFEMDKRKPNFLHQFFPRQVQFPSRDVKIVSVICGYYHTVAYDSDNYIWIFGMMPEISIKTKESQYSISDFFSGSRMKHTPSRVEGFRIPKHAIIRAGLETTWIVFDNKCYSVSLEDLRVSINDWDLPVKDVGFGWKHFLVLTKEEEK